MRQPLTAPRWRFYWLTLLLYLVALLSKTTTCTLPAALLLVAWMQGERLGRRRLLQIVPFLALGLAAGLLSIWWESHLGNYRAEVGQSLTPLERALVATRALWFYAGKLVWPAHLTFSYPHWQINARDLAQYVPLFGCLVVAFMLWQWRERLGQPVIGAVVFFVATLSPLLGFIPLYTFRYSYVADHYQYLACIGLLALAGACLNRLPRFVPAVLLVPLGVLTWQQGQVYRDQNTLWRDTIAKNPASWLAYSNLGVVLKDQGQTDQALHCYQEAIRLQPGYAQAHYNLGIVLFKKGETAEALAQFQEAIRLDPRDCRGYYNFAIALDATGQTNQAIRQYEEAIRRNPDYVAARINLGITFSHLGRIDEALTQFQEAVRLGPAQAEARNNLGAVLRAKGRLDEALEQFQQAIRLNPNHALAHANLGAVLLAKGRIEEAVSQLREALRLNPEDADARRNLAAALERQNTPPAER